MYLQLWYVKSDTFGAPLFPCSVCVLDVIRPFAVYAPELNNFFQILIIVCTA